ncbi:MAG: glycosyltransferase family 2 protein [Lachnospiraceae bacterium]|nr:glycosyltransferase family 2 protein [Lachnospiraceae bacterium]
MGKSVGIVIVNYNGAKYQNDCIRTLYESTFTDFDIIVVDSASIDNSIELLKQKFPDVTVLSQLENVGVAKGNNIGIRYCLKKCYKYIILMNNDIEIDRNMLERLMYYADEKTIVVPKIYYYKPNDLLWYAGGELDWNIASSYHIGINQKDNGQFDILKKVTYAPTCCMVIPVGLFEDIGMIDEKYFMYFDDTDLCARISMSEKFKILYVPEAKMWHKVSSSTGGQGSKIKIYYITRNHLYYMNKFSDNLLPLTKLKVNSRAYVKYLLSFVWRKNNRVIKKAYKDYSKGQMEILK